jgi:FMN reductase (NADPH)
MTTPTIDQIHRHYSVRAYKLDAVAPATVERIVAAGQRASTSSNLQTYSVVAVTDAGKRTRLAELCGGQQQILQAPVFLAWCADLSRLDRICALRGYEHESSYVESFLVAAVDAALAMQNAALAAESLGLGMCYIGAIRNNPDQVIDLLELPRLVFPISGMTLGWPAAEPFIRPRLPLTAILHWEGYGTDGEEQDMVDYDTAMIETGIYKGRQVPVPGQEGEMEDYGWLEHTARRASKAVRTELRQTLEEQGFPLK